MGATILDNCASFVYMKWTSINLAKIRHRQSDFLDICNGNAYSIDLFGNKVDQINIMGAYSM